MGKAEENGKEEGSVDENGDEGTLVMFLSMVMYSMHIEMPRQARHDKHFAVIPSLSRDLGHCVTRHRIYEGVLLVPHLVADLVPTLTCLRLLDP